MIKNKEIYFKLIFDTHAIFPVIKRQEKFYNTDMFVYLCINN